MIKLSRNNLKDLAKNLDAFYCGGNVYNHENITYHIQHKDIIKLNDYTNSNNQVYELIEYLANKTSTLNDKYYITANQIAYSAGTYGNTGQLVKYDIIFHSNNMTIKTFTFYTYYC